MIIHVGGAAVHLIADGDRIVAKMAKEQKPFEPDTLAAWAAALKPGAGVALDVGAYSGLFSISAALLGCKAVAIEPLPVMQERLMLNVHLNFVEAHVELIRAAATDHDGKAQLAYTDVPFTAGASVQRKTAPNKITVKAVTLDTVAARLGLPVCAVKIDVERHELAVLAGAKRLLAEHRPVLIVEVLDDTAATAVLEAVGSGYAQQGGRVDERNIILMPR